MFHDRVATCVRGYPSERYAAFEKTVESVGDCERAGRVLFDDDHRDAARFDRGNDRIEIVDHYWRQAEADFIAQQNARIGEKATAERHHLLFAAGQQAGLLPAPFLEDREQPPHLVEADRALAADRPTEAKVFFYAERGEKPPALRDQRNAPGDDIGCRAASEVRAIEANPAFYAIWLADDCFEEGRFTGAVGADDRDDLSGVDAEFDAVHGFEIAVKYREAFDLEKRGVRPSHRAASLQLPR